MSQYLTTPLYYVNAQPHLGHAFTTILADFMKRHYLQRNEAVVFLTGTDEHGEKIAQYAGRAGKSPQAWADEISADFKKTWDEMGIAYDVFYRTTADSHKKAVQAALQYLFDRKEIVFREYEGLYCLGCERFRTETELTSEGKCPDHETKPERRKEANYFFRMSLYQDRLIEHYRKNPSAIQPDHYRNEMLSHLKEPLEDLCISRPKERLTWGIEIPFDNKYVTYVWFDALLNYLVATGWNGPSSNQDPPSAAWRKQWADSRHLIAKDILRTHAVYWPTMLMALGVQVFRELNVHGYWLMGASKMSKSLGNVIRPLEFGSQYGHETLRYYLLREMSFGLDATFTLEAFIQTCNAHLANGIGNLCSRVLTLCHKGFRGQVLSGTDLEALDRALLAKRGETVRAWDQGFGELKFQNSLKAWSELVTACDLYVNETKPWALAKAAAAGDAAADRRLQQVLGTCLTVLQSLAVIAYPVMPRAAQQILKTLGVADLRFNAPDSHPPIAWATEDRPSYAIAAEVPRLFGRMEMSASNP